MNLGCPKCKSGGALYQKGTVEIEVTRDVDVTYDGAGKPEVKPRGSFDEYSAVDDRDVHIYPHIACGNCDQSFDLDELIRGGRFECRSCGFAGYDATDHDDRECPDPDVQPLTNEAAQEMSLL